jgi:hypothetical protein
VVLWIDHTMCTGTQRTPRSGVLVGTRSGFELLEKAKVEHEELHGNGTGTADMFTPEMLWSLDFIQVQGYEAECVGLYQDNISTQLLKERVVRRPSTNK